MLMQLSNLPKGTIARVRRIESKDSILESKLREIGFAEDDEVEIVHLGPITGRPFCARLNQTLIALRSDEAEAIIVEAVS